MTTRKPRAKKVVTDSNVISFEKFQAIDPGFKRRRIYIEDMGGYVYAKPVPSNMFHELSLVENIEGLPHIISLMARYFAENLSSDEEGNHPLAPYDTWMKLSPAGIMEINKRLQKALGDRGEEKNA